MVNSVTRKGHEQSHKSVIESPSPQYVTDLFPPPVTNARDAKNFADDGKQLRISYERYQTQPMRHFRFQPFLFAISAIASVTLVACNEEKSSPTSDPQLKARLEGLGSERDELDRAIQNLHAENRSQAAEATTELKERDERLKTLKSELKALEIEKESLTSAFEKYKSDYKASIRANAKGIVLGDIGLSKGKDYENVEVTKWEPDGLRVMHSLGSAKLPFEELPAEIQKKFVYDPTETEVLLAVLVEQAKPKKATPGSPKVESQSGITSNAPKPWPKSGLPDDPKRKLSKTEIAIGKLSRRIEAKENEVNILDKQINEAFGRGSDGKGRSLVKRAERIIDDLKTLRANRAVLERKIDSRRRA
jgi:hypothetical protein